MTTPYASFFRLHGLLTIHHRICLGFTNRFERLPDQIGSTIFACLTVDEHACLSCTSIALRDISRRPQSSPAQCWRITSYDQFVSLRSRYRLRALELVTWINLAKQPALSLVATMTALTALCLNHDTLVNHHWVCHMPAQMMIARNHGASASSIGSIIRHSPAMLGTINLQWTASYHYMAWFIISISIITPTRACHDASSS